MILRRGPTDWVLTIWKRDNTREWERRAGDRVLQRTTTGWEGGWIDLFRIDNRDVDRATWADFDQRGRLVFTRDGKLFAEQNEIADFNDMKPEPIAPPPHFLP